MGFHASHSKDKAVSDLDIEEDMHSDSWFPLRVELGESAESSAQQPSRSGHLGPFGKPYSMAEDPCIKEERNCADCRHLRTPVKLWVPVVFSCLLVGVAIWWCITHAIGWSNIMGLVLGALIGFMFFVLLGLNLSGDTHFDNKHCGNKKAIIAAGLEDRINRIAPNLRCRFFTQK
jgi:F0F1-type ATP synthase assembly protein I